MERIKIALFVPWLKSKGGVERIVLAILRDKRYDIDLYTLDYEVDKTFQEFREFHVQEIGRAKTSGFIKKGVNLFAGLVLGKIKNLDRYDIFMISTAGIAELAVFRNKHPLTIALTQTPLRAAHSMYNYYRMRSAGSRLVLPIAVFVYKALEKRAWRRISYAVVLSEEARRRLVDYGLISKDRVFKIGPSVSFRKSIGRKTEKIIFYPSRFTPYKRQELAVKAFIRSKLPSLGFKLVIGGFVEDKSYFEKVKALADNRPDIILESDMNENKLKEIYSKCYATLFLAINEDTGLVPLESLAYGKPVITVNEGGPKEFIKNGENGLLVEANDAKIAAAMEKIADKRYYSKLRNGAIRSPVYDEKRMLKNLYITINHIITNQRGGR